MKVDKIPSAWLQSEGRRLDCGPYMSGARKARLRLDSMKAPKMALKTVTLGGLDGLVNAGRFKRLWVDKPAYGSPFLSSTDILHADLSNVAYISHKAITENPKLLIHTGWTLITRSGTIGRMAYARPDMDGLACSEHVLRVIPDPAKIPAGFLYAYLSSKFGVPLVVEGTYGAIIQHIEPHHIAELPVPRLGDEPESRIHELIEAAACSRADATLYKREAITNLALGLGLSNLDDAGISTSFATFNVAALELSRLDAAHYSPVCLSASKELARSSTASKILGEAARVFTPGIFKRQHVDDSGYGYAYFSGSELFQNGPTHRGYLSKKSPKIQEYLVEKNWLLVQDAGQIGGLIGRVVRVAPDVAGGVVSNHLMRIVPRSDEDGAYLFAVMSSPHGYRSIIRHAFGTSIPQLEPKHISGITIPWPDHGFRKHIARSVLRAWDLEDRAVSSERQAIELVENAIEAAT
jgi:type I restriction enzyme S subunit